MRHVIADTVSAPTKPELRKVAGATHQGTIVVGQAEQIIGAQSGLYVFECDVVSGLAATKRMSQIGKQLAGGRSDIDLLSRDTKCPHQPQAFALVLSEVAKPGNV